MTRRLVGTALLLCVVALGNGAAARLGGTWDLTAERSSTLSDETLRVVRAVKRPATLTAFFARDEVGRVEAATILSRYHRANRLLVFRLVDPTIFPGEARRLGVASSGSVAVARGSRVEIAQDAIEIDLTSAIARLERGRGGTICITSGHGERDPAEKGPEGLSSAAKLLADNGYTTSTVDLLASPAVPGSCDALVIAAPSSRLSDLLVDALRAWMSSAGKLLLLADPESEADASLVTEPWGIGFNRGVVLESDPGSRLADDPVSPIVRRFEGGLSAVRGVPPTFHPGVEAVTVRNLRRDGLSSGPIAQTSERSYLERNPGDAGFTPGTDVPGPIVVGASADDSSVVGAGPRARIKRTRILAFGDVDFASNAFLGDGGNARLLVQSIDWLTQPEALVSAVPSFPKVRELALTQERSRYIGFLTTGVIPGVFLLTGALVWAVRRVR